MIARMWRGKVNTERAAEYVEYITGTGIRGTDKGAWQPRCADVDTISATVAPR